MSWQSKPGDPVFTPKKTNDVDVNSRARAASCRITGQARFQDSGLRPAESGLTLEEKSWNDREGP